MDAMQKAEFEWDISYIRFMMKGLSITTAQIVDMMVDLVHDSKLSVMSVIRFETGGFPLSSEARKVAQELIEKKLKEME